MRFWDRTYQRRFVLIGLFVHFLIWWLAAAVFWLSMFGIREWALLAPIAPLYLGIFYLRSGVWEWGFEGLLVSGVLLGFGAYSIRKPRSWAVWLAHLAIVVYWLFSFGLISTGV